HTYIMNAATTFTDSLYLNAEGNFNAVFVIKIKGALSTSTFSKVLLRNGTQAKNVYWVVDGAVSINDSSVFNGTIICNNAAINLSTGVTLNGRALTTGGALSTASVIATSPFGNCNTLPLKWLYFKGTPDKGNISLAWGTTNEINNGFFTIEKSIDGTMFKKLTIVNTAKESGAQYHYLFTDHEPYKSGYYRISQTDKDGHRNYYCTILVKMNLNQSFNTLPYVQNNYIYVRTSGAVPGKGSIELYNIEGKKISSQKIMLTKEVSIYKIEKYLHKGIYVLYIESEEEKVYHGKVMVQ
ncbi:MAG: ice-binding family protein, partial [Ginsengibacter sp.]